MEDNLIMYQELPYELHEKLIICKGIQYNADERSLSDFNENLFGNFERKELNLTVNRVCSFETILMPL